MAEITVRSEVQNHAVADEVSALVAVIRPILLGLLYTLKEDVVSEVGNIDELKLKMLPRLYRKGDGDCGICYEYAVHDAIQRREESVLERVEDSLKRCKVPGSNLESILFGVEKKGASQLIATAQTTLTDDSRLLTGKRHQPPKLKGYLNTLAAAFRRPTTRLSLPTSINGLWKADLFLGTTDGDRWVGTTVKINPTQLEAANGLRVGVVPSTQGKSDNIRLDQKKNLIICPLPYDGAFMEVFYNGWQIVQQFMHADAQIPKEVNLPTPAHRQVAKELATRREFPVLDVIEALAPIAQPELLTTHESNQTLSATSSGEIILDGLISPIPRAQ
ncbi:hypothetical protein [Nitrogeniibacter aestuarii]|uniref:hypothetical protein n=1 Tax=Nitrogeniibacter aestuarii TaxID=2815343 RepID=UPI001D12A5A4|nr:hypothetical protein [Nitrogeniibacter aestuarii]